MPQIEVLSDDLVQPGRGQQINGVAQHVEHVLVRKLADGRSQLVSVDLDLPARHDYLRRAHRR
jgi:hypothetical protein